MAWRRKLEAGEVATIHELAKGEGFTDRFVSRMMRLAYLSPDALERLALSRDPPAVSVNALIEISYLPRVEQPSAVFNDI